MTDKYEIRFDPKINKYRLYKIIDAYNDVTIYPGCGLPGILDRLNNILGALG